MLSALDTHALERGCDHAWYVKVGAQWVRRAQRCRIVLTFKAAVDEEPDVIGFGPCAKTTVIECKRSRADFKRDSLKPFRRFPEFGMGNYRYYLSPSGLLMPDEIPSGWGLLTTDAAKVTMVREATYQPSTNVLGELRFLLSYCYRERLKGGETEIDTALVDGLGL